ncbi:uncharacterized protein [Diabrotica undecimpunctata]|uniref:uncharacterized protein n=1 Tax=Diabrotica undecimpunctata TaxID=50387 RepID=UPI003B63D4FD
MGFVYEKRGKKAVMMERPDIINWRHKFLRKIQNYRNQGYNIFYLDESWVNIEHTVNKVWMNSTITSYKDAFLKGLTTGLNDPKQRSPRFVLLHVGSDRGFLPNSACVFLAKKDSGDYHDKMNGKSFENWFENKLIANLPKGEKNVVVMDNAPYHSCKQNFPRSSWNKQQIQEWLGEKDIFYEEDYLKSELLDVANSYADIYDKYNIETLVEKYGVEVLRLPPYHCELNPIEMVWN